MKIFIGCTEICGLLNVYKKGFESLGHTVTTCTANINKYYSEEKYDIYTDYLWQTFRGNQDNIYYGRKRNLSDRIIGKIWSSGILNSYINRSIIQEHDLFIFLWAGRYLTPGLKMLEDIKRANKKIVSILVGSDVRYPNAFSQEYNVSTDKWPSVYFSSFSTQNNLLRNVELYSDVIYSVPDQMGLAVRPYNHFQIPLNIEKYNFRNTGNERPVVLHAPSNAGIKGSDVILSTLNKLKDNGLNFELKFLENVPNKQLISILSDSDILVDELILHGPGVLSFEAMASGCAVATRTLDQFYPFFAPPVVSINEATIYKKIESLISDINFRNKLITEGRKYVLENNSVEIIVKKIISDLQSPTPLQYTPLFFRDHFQLAKDDLVTENDKILNSTVANKWLSDYKTYESSLQQRRLIK